MNDNELKRMELESSELLDMLHEVRDEDNSNLRISPCPRPNKILFRVSPYWLVAASVLGFVLGMAMPRDNGYAPKEYSTLLADTSYTIGRSLAAGDINFALLVN